jgi:hypothetical protein
VAAGHEILGLRQAARPLAGRLDLLRIDKRLPQQRALVVRVGAVPGRPQRLDKAVLGALDPRAVPSVSISATSTPSSEVPLIKPIASTRVSPLAIPPDGCYTARIQT